MSALNKGSSFVPEPIKNKSNFWPTGSAKELSNELKYGSVYSKAYTLLPQEHRENT